MIVESRKNDIFDAGDEKIDQPPFGLWSDQRDLLNRSMNMSSFPSMVCEQSSASHQT